MRKFYLLIISLLALNAYPLEIKHSLIAEGLTSLEIGYDLKISTSHISFLTSTSMDFTKDANDEWSQKRRHIFWNLTALYGKDFPIKNSLFLRPSLGLIYILDYRHYREFYSDPDAVSTYSMKRSTYLFLARLSFLKQFEHIFAGIYSDLAFIDISNQIRRYTGEGSDRTEYSFNFCLRPQFLFGYMF